MLDKQSPLTEICLRIRAWTRGEEVAIQAFADKLEIGYTNVVKIDKG